MLVDRICSSCKHKEEDLLEHHDAKENIKCPKCGKITFKRQLPTSSSFIINGFSSKNNFTSSVIKKPNIP